MLTHRIVPERPSIGARVVLGLWLVAPVLAELHTPLPDGWDRGFGLQRLDGALLGLGPRYLVRFEPTGFALTPALGTAAPKARPLAFSLDSVWRGEARLYQSPREGVVPVEEGPFVRYDRGFLIESYEVRQDGIEQSFRFDALPPGTGDLVVRGRVRTELPAPPAGAAAEGLRFEVAGLGGVSIGAVTGIDADGRRAAGTLRFDGTFVELSLPAAFVEAATLPLVLDPLVGPTITLTSGDDRDPDVAFDGASSTYLVVWERAFSGIDTLVVGQRLDSTGALLGAVFGITPTLDAIDPVVASVSTGSLFFVAWKERFGGLRGRSVDATGSPTQRPVVTISSAVSSTEPDIGRQGLGPACLVVYRTPSGIRIHAVNPSTSFVGPPVTVTSNPNDSAPAILKQSTFFRFLVVWQRLRPADGTHDVLGLAVETGAGHPLILTAEHVIAGETVADEERPVCAGSSDRFLVVYEKQPNGTTGDSDIACRGVSLVETSRWELVISAEAIAAGGSTYDQKHPTVAFAQHQYLVAWSSTGGLAFQNGLYVRGLDLNTCVPCGSPVQFAVSLAGTVNDFPKIGPAVWDQGMIVWQAVSATEGGDIKARLVEAFGTGGAVVDLGGRCGLGGTATVFGPAAIGNGTFRFLLTGASERAAAAAFNLSLPGVPFTCGSCTVTPYFWTVPCGIGGGSSSLLFPIPCEPALIGLTVEAQWTVLLTEQTPCPLSLGASFSNRIHVTVGS